MPVNAAETVCMLKGTDDGGVPLTKISQINRTMQTIHFPEPPRLTTCLYLLIYSWMVRIRSRSSRWCHSSNSMSVVSANLSLRSFNNQSQVHAMEVTLSNLSLAAFASLPDAFTAIFASLISACSSPTHLFMSYTVWSTAFRLTTSLSMLVRLLSCSAKIALFFSPILFLRSRTLQYIVSGVRY